MIYLLGEKKFEARTAAELVRRMHKASWAPAADDREWMMDTAERARLQNGAKVRTDDPVIFVADLEAAGLIKRVR